MFQIRKVESNCIRNREHNQKSNANYCVVFMHKRWLQWSFFLWKCQRHRCRSGIKLKPCLVRIPCNRAIKTVGLRRRRVYYIFKRGYLGQLIPRRTVWTYSRTYIEPLSLWMYRHFLYSQPKKDIYIYAYDSIWAVYYIFSVKDKYNIIAYNT